MRFILIGALVTLVAGCVLPPAVTIASYAADGISYLITGKSVTDHALSEVVGEDCATWRMIKLENPCRPYEDEDGDAATAVAEAEATDGTAPALAEGGQETVDSAPVMTVTELPVEDAGTETAQVAPEAIEPAAGQPKQGMMTQDLAEPAAEPEQLASATPMVSSRPVAKPDGTERRSKSSFRGKGPEVFLVMGSFSRESNAKRLANKHAGFRPIVVSAHVGQTTVYRVVTQVDGRAALDRAQRRLAKAGLADAWIIETCTGGIGANCLAWTERRAAKLQVAAAH